MELSQQEAEQLFQLSKISGAIGATIYFPIAGEKIEIELESRENKRIKFQADISMGNKIASKLTLQLRHQKIYILRRVDFDGNHRNPPGLAPDPIFEGYEGHTFQRQDHVHFYMEGYGEKWALPLEKK